CVLRVDCCVGYCRAGGIDNRTADGAVRGGLRFGNLRTAQHTGDAEKERRKPSRQTTRFHAEPPRMFTSGRDKPALLLPRGVGASLYQTTSTTANKCSILTCAWIKPLKICKQSLT